ncbi:tripartite tricarboxylate transporter substrate binding protein [Aquincola sp. S2]|uniref:Tripartite tricarboxylate transporter substrate binding protein n=1 Tax=Pseudaquabacterium terrae TaxID=2732868 RepID=A0ABX2EPY7_9BURK|nr:tripartite tricarboxylate transporter substrate binding protein [Aquabacterium terrae]NRF70744.1 tripartite tricarboxylate transporter substrate binding protein [Aquabacterium terrae]
MQRLFVAAALAAFSLLAQAQAWPAKPVTVIVPFPAGGGTDAFARPLFAQLTKQLGQQVIIDNRGGAGGNIGASMAARATADGHTWLMGAVHHAIAPAVYPKLDYSLAHDFVPVALLASVPQVIVANPQRVPGKTLKELLAQLRAPASALNYGSAGNGTSHHLAGELFKLQTKTAIGHVPYKGAGPALQDLIGGQVDLMFDGLGSSATHIKNGRLKAIAIAGTRRATAFPDIPTTVEAGVPDYQVSTWYGLWAPKNTPPAVIERMTQELAKALAAPEIKAAWTALGADTPALVGAAFGEFVAFETKRWADVVKAASVKLD